MKKHYREKILLDSFRKKSHKNHFKKKLTFAVATALVVTSYGVSAADQTADNQNQTRADNLSKDNKVVVDPGTQLRKVTTPGVRLSTVTVNAKRTKTLKAAHDDPESVSVVTGSDLNAEAAQDYQAITKRLANVTFNHSNTRGASLSIRGIGKRGFAEVQDPSVLVSQDGVSYGLTALGNFDFYDIETVESFRGVQGTTGGKGASVGEFVVTTKKPSFTPSSDFSLTFGSRGTELIHASATGLLLMACWRGAGPFLWIKVRAITRIIMVMIATVLSMIKIERLRVYSFCLRQAMILTRGLFMTSSLRRRNWKMV